MELPSNTIVHLVTPYLFPSGSWVYAQLLGLRSFRNVVFTQKKENLSQFPFESIIAADDLPQPKKFINKVSRRITNTYGLFFRKYHDAESPALYQAHMGFEGVRWLSFVQKTGTPLVTTFYGQDVSRLGKIPKWQKEYKKLFEYGTAFLAEGSFLKKQLVMIGCPEEKVIVQHLGVAVESYSQKKLESFTVKPKVILQIAWFGEKKGFEYSLQAIALLKKRIDGFIFRLIGGADEKREKEIRQLVISLGIEDVVELAGRKSHRECLDEMQRAFLFLHPSVTAESGDNEGGAPVVITEASALGLPVVSSFHCDIPEVVIHNKTGLLAEEKDSATLADHLFALLSEPELAFKMGAAGRVHIEQEYNLAIQLQRLQSIYTRVIEQRRPKT